MKTDVAIEIRNIMDSYTSKCSTFLEFGSRGAISGILTLGGLDLGRTRSKFRPRFVCVDLIHDDSISKIEQLALANNISFQFWKGHSSQYPIHEIDGLFWDCFHSGGAVFHDLNRMAPYVHKYIMVMGMVSFGDKSEGELKGFDMSSVAKELHMDEASARMNMKDGVAKFLSGNKDWVQAKEFSELCILERVKPSDKDLFKVT